jgi:hypothetical protein
MNMMMLIQFTAVSRRVSVLFKLIGITAPYLGFIIVFYIFILFLMGYIVW